MQILLSILVKAGTALLTERFVINVSLLLLEKLAASTKNNLDDKLVHEVRLTLKGEN